MRIGSLFSGIGGLELGLERAGVGEVIWQCEIDPFCRAVLAKHWPNVTRFEDVTRPRDWPKVDVICGGFPCQDVSSAGKRRGLGGERSSLWWHFASVVQQVAPRFVVVENVTSGKRKWLPQVRRSLHLLGYDSVALGIAARDVGAPHRRERVFVVAHAYREHLRKQPGGGGRGSRRPRQALAREHGEACALADADGPRLEGQDERGEELAESARRGIAGRGAWSAEPEVGRVAHGVPGRVDRMRALGNAVVPQCAEVAGRVILAMLPHPRRNHEVHLGPDRAHERW
jgi:DNA (cytosine-5)-methyltransferase 1